MSTSETQRAYIFLTTGQIGGEETVQSWVNETNYRANRYFDSSRNVDEEEEARENDYVPAQGDNTKQKKLYAVQKFSE